MRRIPKPPNTELKRLFKTRAYTLADLSQRYKCDRGTVRKWLIAAGLKPLSRSETALLVQSRRSYEELLKNSEASRALITGKKRSHADLCKRALGKMRNAKPSKYEASLLAKLRRLNIRPTLNLAVDKYNIDLGFLDLKLAIEIDGGNWHKTSNKKVEQDRRKSAYLQAHGWNILRINTHSEQWLSKAVIFITSVIKSDLR